MEDFYWYWLCNISGIGNSRIHSLLQVFETPKNVYHAEERLLEKVKGINKANIADIIHAARNHNCYLEFCRLKEKGIYFTHPQKDDYPKQFLNIYDMPYALYYKGRLPEENRPVVAIVGARNCTEYGKAIAHEFASAWARMGIQVVSGMALGIDAAAHRGALQGNGYTCAVLGCGVDICYPRDNISLYSNMVELGGVLSEYMPGTKPNAGQFPMRNRLISALADVVVVVEARKKSGSLITVDQALEQNKDIMAVPGRIKDALSEGCNSLIQMGAQVLLKPEDILSNTRISMHYEKNRQRVLYEENIAKNVENSRKNRSEETKRKKEFNNSVLASQKDMLYSGLNLYPTSINTIIEETQLSIPEISALLLELELEGLVKEVSKGCYVRVHI